MNTNLVTLWSVQPASGMDSLWFTTREAALKKFEDLNAEVDAAFERWEQREPGLDSLVQSYLEGDCFGGVLRVSGFLLMPAHTGMNTNPVHSSINPMASLPVAGAIRQRHDPNAVRYRFKKQTPSDSTEI